MKSAAEVDALIVELKAKVNAGEMTLSEAVFETAKSCEGWPYTFGAEGRKVTKNGIVVRTFDCQGFTEWCLEQFGINIKAAGCTSQWNNESLWLAKGTIDTVPEDVLTCLFYRDKTNPNKMAHTGFGLHGQTVECSSGVQFFEKRNTKWTYWAIPKGITEKATEVDPTYRPVLRRGDKGQYVTLAQTELMQRGYDLGKWGVDGSFGAATEAAVKAFQQNNGLTADGICGPKTWAALDAAQPGPEPKPEPAEDRYTVTIPGVSLQQAEELCKEWSGASMKKE